MKHKGQFAILKKAIDLPGYRHLALSGGWILSWHEKLRMHYDPDNHLLLLGLAWQVMPDRRSPEEELDALSPAVTEKEILAMEETWCGRYVLIHGTRVYMDACGLLSVFYSDIGICSDCGLLAETMGLGEKIYTPAPGIVMNWMPGPMTHYEQITRQMSNQIYDFQTGDLLPRDETAASYRRIDDVEQLTARFVSLFGTSLRHLQDTCPEKKMMIALTGGYDSRTLLAMAHHAGLQISAFTLEHEHIQEDDILLPPRLCERIGVPYRCYPRDKSRYDPALEEEYIAHTAGLIRDEDRILYAYGQYQQMISEMGDVMLLRSSVWSDVTEYFRKVFIQPEPQPMLFEWFGVEENSVEMASLKKYFDWQHKYPDPGFVSSNAFQLLQREGCWLSAIESGFDLLDHAVSLQPLNSRYLLTMLLDFPREERLLKAHQKRIIRYACPEIADIPFARSKIRGQSAPRVAVQKIGRAVYRLRHLGLKKTLATYQSMAKTYLEKKRLTKNTKVK